MTSANINVQTVGVFPFSDYGVAVPLQGYGIHPASLLTRQLGVPLFECDVADCTVPVFFTTQTAMSAVQAFLRRGGTVITTDESSASDAIRKDTDCVLELAGTRTMQFWTAKRGRGLLIIVPADALHALHDYRRHWFAFGSPGAEAIAPCCPTRKGELHRYWRHVLRAAFAHHGLPLVHAWYFPGVARTHCALRVDADWYDQTQWDDTLRVTETFGSAASWYLTTKTVQGDARACVDRVRERGSEVGSHGHVHHTFWDEENNVANMRLADAELRALGIEPTSFVSPSAKWNTGVQRAVEQLGYAMSSEFSYSWDCYPVSPIIDGRASSALQVPVHPVSPGNFLKHGVRDGSVIAEYVRRTARHLYDECLPMHLYGHPSDIPVVGSAVLSEVANWPDTHRSSLRDYAAWWSGRRPGSLQLRREEDAVLLVRNGAQADVRLAVSWDERAFFLTDATTVRLTSWPGQIDGAIRVEMTRHDPPYARPTGRRVGLRSRIGEWLDYESSLPSRHHVIHDVRTAINGVVKRLRGL